MKVFVHTNYGSPKLWAADEMTQTVVFGSLVEGSPQERTVSNNLASKIRQKINKGYDYIVDVETPRDAIALIYVFSHRRVIDNIPDPAGVIRGVEEIIYRYPTLTGASTNWAFKKLEDINQSRQVKESPPEPASNKNLLIITNAQSNSDWDLVI